MKSNVLATQDNQRSQEIQENSAVCQWKNWFQENQRTIAITLIALGALAMVIGATMAGMALGLNSALSGLSLAGGAPWYVYSTPLMPMNYLAKYLVAGVATTIAGAATSIAGAGLLAESRRAS